MRSILRSARTEALAETRIFCLPGAYHTAQDFVTAGFDTRVRARGLSIDLSFVDIDLEHLGDRRPLHHLRQDLILPARAAGYRSIWLAGISLGGLIALDYAAMNPGDLDGLCLLAPYLGNRLLTREIARAPGLAAWIPGDLAQTDEERRIWCFIRQRSMDASAAPAPLWYLGFGSEDRFADAHRLLAQALPRCAVDEVPGGHDWGTWIALWESFLDSRFA